MKRPSFINFTVFVVFFGAALIEVLREKNWSVAGLFFALGILSLWADFKRKHPPGDKGASTVR